MQLYLAVGLPILAVLASLTVSLVQISGIREEMRDLRTDSRETRSLLNARFDSVERRLEMIQGDTHQMDIRLTKVEAKG